MAWAPPPIPAAFEEAHGFILDAFASQGIRFEAVFICPHRAHDGCECRKPRTGLVREYLRAAARRSRAQRRDRRSGHRPRVRAQSRHAGAAGAAPRQRRRRPGPQSCASSHAPSRRRASARRARRRSTVAVDLERTAPIRVADRHRVFRSHARAARQARRLRARARAAAATCTSTSITRSRTAHSRSARRCAARWVRRRGIARYGFLLPMDEARGAGGDRSVRPRLRRVRGTLRSR